VVAVLGLKNSGKTTVAEALISALSAQGLRVAAVKTSHLARLDLDSRHRDSRQLYDAGAVCVVAQAREQTLIVRRHDHPATFSEILGLLPSELHFVVLEGGAAAEADVVLLCLRSLGELDETLKVRDVPQRKLRALTGLAAVRPTGSEGKAGDSSRSAQVGTMELPLLDAADPAGRQALLRLVLTAAGISESPQR
jgi:molybdopterin-guanine dinucleotide biosynthesis protein MobB